MSLKSDLFINQINQYMHTSAQIGISHLTLFSSMFSAIIMPLKVKKLGQKLNDNIRVAIWIHAG